MEKVRSQSEETSQNKIRRIQEKMQNEINLAEQNETEMQRKFSEARTKTNQVTEELIAEKHKSNLLAVELNEKEQRLHKLMTERFFICFYSKWFVLDAVFLRLIPLLLRDYNSDLDETFRVYTVSGELLHGHIFNFRSRTENRKLEFSRRAHYSPM